MIALEPHVNITKALRSPPWHRRQRLKRQKARRVVRALRNRAKVSLSQVVRLKTALVLLLSHHTRPRYSLSEKCKQNLSRVKMSWNKSWRSWGHHGQPQNQPYHKQRKEDKEQGKQGKPQITGYDGVKLPLPDSSASSSDQPSSSAAKSTFTKEDVRSAIQDFMTAFRNGEDLPESLTKMVEADPGEKIRAEQKEVNKKRKALQKIQKLEDQITDKQTRFTAWQESMTTLMSHEEARHAENMKKLQEQLQELKDQDMETNSDVPSSAAAQELEKKSGEVDELRQQNMYLQQQLTDLLNMVTQGVSPEPTTHHGPPLISSPGGNQTPKLAIKIVDHDALRPFRVRHSQLTGPYTPTTASTADASRAPAAPPPEVNQTVPADQLGQPPGEAEINSLS